MKNTLLIGLFLLTQVMAGQVFAEDVYATKNGKKYHKIDCEYIKDRNASKIEDNSAVKKGLKPCGACFKLNTSMDHKNK